MAEAPPESEPKPAATTSSFAKRKAFISPTSSFVDFAELESEYYSAEGRELAHTYNPHKNRHFKKATTDFETATHLLKSSVGAGLLAMPKAFSDAGVIIGCIGTIFLTSICIYAMTILLKMQYIQCQRLRVPFLTMPRSMKVAFKNGPPCLHWMAYIAPWLVDFVMVSFQLGICVAYIIFIARSIGTVAIWLEIVKEKDIKDLDLKIIMLIMFIPVCLTNYIRSLKKLMPLSLLANILICFTLISCLYFVFFVGPWKTEQVQMVATWKKWPLFMGTVLFSLEAVGAIIALEHHMDHPDHYIGSKGLLPWCLVVVASLYFITGNIGYCKWGSDVGDTIFDSLPKGDGFAVILYGVYGFCIFLTYPLQCYVALEIMWGNYIRHCVEDPMKECIVEYVMRTLTTVFTFVVAMLIPHIDIVISLVGAFCISFLGIIAPFMLELCTKYPDEYGPLKWIIIKDFILILIGVVILVLGTYISLLEVF